MDNRKIEQSYFRIICIYSAEFIIYTFIIIIIIFFYHISLAHQKFIKLILTHKMFGNQHYGGRGRFHNNNYRGHSDNRGGFGMNRNSGNFQYGGHRGNDFGGNRHFDNNRGHSNYQNRGFDHHRGTGFGFNMSSNQNMSDGFTNPNTTGFDNTRGNYGNRRGGYNNRGDRGGFRGNAYHDNAPMRGFAFQGTSSASGNTGFGTSSKGFGFQNPDNSYTGHDGFDIATTIQPNTGFSGFQNPSTSAPEMIDGQPTVTPISGFNPSNPPILQPVAQQPSLANFGTSALNPITIPSGPAPAPLGLSMPNAAPVMPPSLPAPNPFSQPQQTAPQPAPLPISAFNPNNAPAQPPGLFGSSGFGGSSFGASFAGFGTGPTGIFGSGAQPIAQQPVQQSKNETPTVLTQFGFTDSMSDIYGNEDSAKLFQAPYTKEKGVPEALPPKSIC